MFAYSTLVYFKLKYGFQPLLKDEQLQRLYSVFKKEKLMIKPGTITIPSYLVINWEKVAHMNMSEGRKNGIYELDGDFLENIDGYRNNKFLNIGAFPHYLWIYRELFEDIKQHFIFHDHLTKHVKQWKNSILSQYANTEVIFVGVHCRRTDYAKHLNNMNGGATLVNKTFYEEALRLYRIKYNSKDHKVIFLAVSDDYEWIKNTIGEHDDVFFSKEYSNEHVRSSDEVGFDLNILASCDHSVFAYGTFGLWGALLAGGDVIVSKVKLSSFKISARKMLSREEGLMRIVQV